MQNKCNDTAEEASVNHNIFTFFFSAVFCGRCRRGDYAIFLIGHIVFCFICSYVFGAVGGLIYGLISFLPNCAIFVRRMHDIGVSGRISSFFGLLYLFAIQKMWRLCLEENVELGESLGYIVVMGVVFLVFIVSLLKRGVVGDNIYGKDPKGSRYMKTIVDTIDVVGDNIYGKVPFDSNIPKLDMITIPNRNYKLQRTVVTQELWKAVMGDNPSCFTGSNRPVENVSWDDCQEFIKKLNKIEGANYRLPTEEEWEYACKAGATGDWGGSQNGEEGSLDAMGWYLENSNHITHDVAQKEPNAWGLYDMHGNVCEWCQDQCSLQDSRRVSRGGSCCSSASSCTASMRTCLYPGERSRDLGFRLACSLD